MATTAPNAASDRARSAGVASAPPGAISASFVLFAALAALVSIVYLAAEWWHLGGTLGFPTDVAWTRSVFARSVASGEGLCFNPGSPAAGAPAPAWVACLAAMGFFLGNFVLTAKLLGVLSVIVAAYLVWFITLSVLRDWRFAFLAALLTAVSPRLVSAALGGEESAFGAVLLAAVLYLQSESWRGYPRQRRLLAVAAGLAALVRPELILLLPLMLIDRLLVSRLRRRNSAPLRQVLAAALPEVLGAALLLLPYLFYNWRVGGALWQQPSLSLRPVSPATWPVELLGQLWRSNPVVLLAALAGLPVALLALVRARDPHFTTLLAVGPITFILIPGMIWRQADPSNAAQAAAYLTPFVSILGSAGLFLACRAAGEGLSRAQPRFRRLGFGLGVGAAVVALSAFSWTGQRAAWQQHGAGVRQVSDLQAYIGRYAFDHLPPDASIACREVGAIGFYSRRRVVDLGGTIDSKGIQYLRRPGSPDSNLLEYLTVVRPSHLAIRPGDFPYLSERADLLVQELTCEATDPTSGGTTTMKLYRTPYPSPSLRAAQEAVGAN